MIYNLFISHSWSYSNDYDGLVNLLNEGKRNFVGFDYKNYSVPKDDPIHNAPNTNALRQAIENQMKSASCVLILAGVYATYSKWINIEIELARKMGKKIIAIDKRGADKTSTVVHDAASKEVKWNSKSIIEAIRECA